MMGVLDLGGGSVQITFHSEVAKEFIIFFLYFTCSSALERVLVLDEHG